MESCIATKNDRLILPAWHGLWESIGMRQIKGSFTTETDQRTTDPLLLLFLVL
jgi:hypothetical protein